MRRRATRCSKRRISVAREAFACTLSEVDVACPGGGGAREEELKAVSGDVDWNRLERDDDDEEGRAALGRARFGVA